MNIEITGVDLAESEQSGRTANISNEPEGAEQWVKCVAFSWVSIIWKEEWGQGMIESQETRVISLSPHPHLSEV